jgi:hypothetical protein
VTGRSGGNLRDIYEIVYVSQNKYEQYFVGLSVVVSNRSKVIEVLVGVQSLGVEISRHE